MEILITGGGSGIGKALVEELLKQQACHITIVGRRLKPLVDLQNISPKQISVIQTDVSTSEGRNTIVEQVKQTKPLTHIIHCAGIVEPLVPIESLSLDDFRQTMATNMEAPLFLTQTLIPFMQENCRSLFISSSAVKKTFTGMAAYGISKGALEMMIQSLQLEYRKQPLYFTAVRPGGVKTQIIEKIKQANTAIESYDDSLKKRIDDGYFHEPSYAASFIAWVLLNTSNEAFQHTWDMSDAEHKNKWLESTK